MDRGYYRYEDPYGRPRRKANLFAWTIGILLLFGVAFAAWLGSYYIFSQPERPESYRILKKLHKVEQPKRFQLTAAPPGEFLTPRQLHERYSNLRPAELAKLNAELTRNFIRNYQQVAGLVPYVVGRYTIMDTHELGADDVFASGVATLSNAVDFGELLMEHVYPADAQSVPLMKQTLVPGLEIKLERAHDLSSVVHVERLPDGRVLITVVPLLYGSYTVTQGRGMFSLEPPFDLNLAAGWPLFKADARREAEARYLSSGVRNNAASPGLNIPGITTTPPPVATNELIRVEPAVPLETPSPSPTSRGSSLAKATPTPKGGKLAKNEKPSPSPSVAIAAAKISPSPAALAAATPSAPTPVPLAALPVTGDALASTAGGGSWKTYPAGKMPAGRLITPSDLNDVAERGLGGERVYLRGQFVVNFSESNRAVLRPRQPAASAGVRVVVEFPSGYTPPGQGAAVNRDEARPYEITEVRKQSDGQLNVFVREIMQ